MAKECLRDCPVLRRIESNIEENKESDILTEIFNNGLNSAIKASDNCKGPLEKEVKQRKRMRTITLAEPLKVCGWNVSIQNEIIPTP